MLSLIQRVTSATVTVEGEVVGTIEAGLLALVGVEPGDGEAQIARMAERVLWMADGRIVREQVNAERVHASELNW